MKRWAVAGRYRFGSTLRAKRWAPRCCGWRSKSMSGNSPPSLLEVSRAGRVLSLVMNRPEKRNALNGALCRELVAAIEQGDQDAGVGAILVAGAGKCFCSGMDLSEMLTPAAAGLAEVHERL